MFTGIVEAMGQLIDKKQIGSNVDFWFTCPFTANLQIDQSLAHNGVCLTVVEIKGDAYRVTAIEETLQKTNLNNLNIGSKVNLERCLAANGRFDGHIVQGHVDTTGVVTNIEEFDGSWKFHFEHPVAPRFLTVEKGSICVNGTSLTVVDSTKNTFSVAIIPYTYDYTIFNQLQVGDLVNLEFDILGKYLAKIQLTN